MTADALGGANLDERDAPAHWLELFRSWLADVQAAELPEPTAMILASADAQGRPSARTVLLKDVDEQGFVFYTNHESRKGRELAVNAHAALVFPWHPLHRQVLVSGAVQRASDAMSDAYF